jgi:hypothetical protein
VTVLTEHGLRTRQRGWYIGEKARVTIPFNDTYKENKERGQQSSMLKVFLDKLVKHVI